MQAGNSLPQPLLSDFSGEEPTGTLAVCEARSSGNPQSDASASQYQTAWTEMQAPCTAEDGYYLRLV